MELMKRDFLTITDEGENICMYLDTTHEAVRKSERKWQKSGQGLKWTEKGLYCVIRDEGDFIDW